MRTQPQIDALSMERVHTIGQTPYHLLLLQAPQADRALGSYGAIALPVREDRQGGDGGGVKPCLGHRRGDHLNLSKLGPPGHNLPPEQASCLAPQDAPCIEWEEEDNGQDEDQAEGCDGQDAGIDAGGLPYLTGRHVCCLTCEAD